MWEKGDTEVRKMPKVTPPRVYKDAERSLEEESEMEEESGTEEESEEKRKN